jgi:hypothetical protein
MFASKPSVYTSDAQKRARRGVGRRRKGEYFPETMMGASANKF